MAIFVPQKVVLNWYRYDVGFSIELMHSFVRGVEKQATASLAEYRAKRTAREHQGLDGDTWDLDSIFEEHFPSLQRRSALLTVWGFLEHELDKLCSLYQSEKGFKLAVSDLSEKGIDRSTNYLEKVAGLNGLKASPEWNNLKTLQRIRNLIAHEEGKLRDRNGKPRDRILKDMKDFGFLKGEVEILVAEGFLPKTLDICKSYFKLIGKVIEANETAEIISRRKTDN